MQPTTQQLLKINQMQENNPSMLPIEWGYFSNGDISLHIRWSFEPGVTYFQTIDKAGEFVGQGTELKS